MMYTLGTAAKATGKSKTTISNAIKKGKISAKRDEQGAYQIDPAELHRVYPLASQDDDKHEQDETPKGNGGLQVEVKMLREQLERERSEAERERRQLETTIDDLRARLDASQEQQQRLTLLLTHQQEQPRQLSFTEWLFGTRRPSKTKGRTGT